MYSKGQSRIIDINKCNIDNIETAYCIDDLTLSIHDNIDINVLCNESIEFMYGYYDILFDFVDLKTDVIKKTKTNKIIFKSEIKHYTEYSVKLGRYESDMGYVFTDMILNDYLYYERENTYSISKDVGDSNLNISIKPDFNGRKLFSRSYYKGQNFFAELGGIFNFVYILAYNINLIHSIIHLNLTIDKECKISTSIEKVIYYNTGN